MSSTFLRFLSRNKLYTFIEVFGLSVSLGFILLLAGYVGTDVSVGRGQKMSKELYVAGTGTYLGMTLGTADEFFPSVPQIDRWTRMSWRGSVDVSVGEDIYSVNAAALDTNFLQFFDYGLRGCGRDRILSSDDEVIVSGSFAAKAFGNEDPVGKTLNLRNRTFTVAGVLDDFGAKDAFLPCELFFPFSLASSWYSRMDNFGSTLIFMTLKEGTSPEEVADALLDKYVGYWNYYRRTGDENTFIYGSTLTRFDKIYYSGMQSSGMRSGDRSYPIAMMLVAIVLLLTSVFNYINLTVAQAGKRAGEMATRRLLGESRGRIALRYFLETLAFTVFCLAVGALVAAAFHPVFERLLGAKILFDFSPAVYLVCALAVVLLAAVAAAFPASLSLRFKPIDVVKGSCRFKSKMVFSKVFIVLQNVISCTLIAVALTMTLQLRHLTTMPLGYNTEDIVYVRTSPLGYDIARSNALLSRLEALDCVEEGGMAQMLPFYLGHDGVKVEGEEAMAWLRLTRVDTTVFRLLGFEVVERYDELPFGKVYVTEDSRSRFGVTENSPTVGMVGANHWDVCGVVKDFRSGNAIDIPLDDSHGAVYVFDDADPDGWAGYVVLKTHGGHAAAVRAISAEASRLADEMLGFPYEFEVQYLDDYFAGTLDTSRNMMKLVFIFMVLAILISALGLFAMSIYYTEQQGRRIAISKVFGSDEGRVVRRLSRNFIVLSLVAAVVAVPLSFFVMERYLQSFHNRIDFPWWVLVAAAVLSLLISFAAIISRTVSASRKNPVETLKQE